MTLVIEPYIPKKERKKTTELFQKYFDADISKEIEHGVYDYTIQYCQTLTYYKSLSQAIYNDQRNNLLYNFEQNCSTIKKIKKDVCSKKFNPYNLAFLRPEELNSDTWVKIIMRIKTTDEKLNNLPAVTWRPCYRCKCTKYGYYLLQTRSIDEPMTIFYTCKDCGTTYKVNN